MGDMADFALECMMNADDYYLSESERQRTPHPIGDDGDDIINPFFENSQTTIRTLKPPTAKVCIAHNAPLIRSQTRFGGRWSCPVDGCTVRCWDGSTSTPCDHETARARHDIHAIFDPLWKESGHFKGPKQKRRLDAYRWLAKEMGLPLNETHFGMFDLTQCERAKVIIGRRIR